MLPNVELIDIILVCVASALVVIFILSHFIPTKGQKKIVREPGRYPVVRVYPGNAWSYTPQENLDRALYLINPHHDDQRQVEGEASPRRRDDDDPS